MVVVKAPQVQTNLQWIALSGGPQCWISPRFAVPPVFTDWLGFDERYRAFPIHLSYFTERTLLRLLEKHGFTVERITTTGLGLDRLIFQRDERKVGNSFRNRAPSVRGRMRRFVIDASKKLFFGLRMGENLLMIARLSSHSKRHVTGVVEWPAESREEQVQ
jgi:hypothetical protein